MSAWTVRPEAEGDAARIGAVVSAAFADAPHADGDEAALVERLRAGGDLALSLVAEDEEGMIGHIGFSPLTVGGESNGWMQLAPLAVVTHWRGEGVARSLIVRGIAELRERGAQGIGVLGEPALYEKFGFGPASGMILPADQQPFYRALALDGDLPRGEVRYADAFYG